MNVSATSPAAIPTASRASSTHSSAASAAAFSTYGSLSTQQLKTLRAAVGYDFNWPPADGSGPFPIAAAMLSEGGLGGDIASQKQLTESGLRALAAAGFLDRAALARGTAYLRNGTSFGDTPPTPAPASRPTSGTVTTDGSIYL